MNHKFEEALTLLNKVVEEEVSRGRVVFMTLLSSPIVVVVEVLV